MSRLPTICWSCDANLDNPKYALYRIPSSSGYFTMSMINSKIESIPSDAIIGFCSDCGYEHLLKQYPRNGQCKSCGIYFSYVSNYNHCKYCQTSTETAVAVSNYDHCEYYQTSTETATSVSNNDDLKELEQYNVRSCIKCNMSKSSNDYDRGSWDLGSKETAERREGLNLFPIYHNHVLDLDGFPCIGNWCKVTDGTAEIREGLTLSKFKVDLEHNGWVCSKCFDLLDKEPILNVECHICHKRFPSCFNDSGTAGHGCSTDVDDYIIRCGFGSRYDFNVYQWSTPVRPLEYSKINNMCDDCINEFLSNGTIISTNEF